MRIKKLIKAREKDFNKKFPDAIDMLSVCVEAGLGLDSAIERVGRNLKHFSPTIGHEFAKVIPRCSLRNPRHRCFKNLTKRIRCKDLQSF